MSCTMVRLLHKRSRSQVMSEVKLCLKLCCTYTTEANLMKLHRKINIMGRFSPTRCRFLRPRSRLQSGQRSKSCFSNNSKATEANLTKLHRKMEIIRRCVTHKGKVPTPEVKVTIMSVQNYVSARTKKTT